MKKSKEIKQVVKEKYSKLASTNSGCGCGCNSSLENSKTIGYTNDDLEVVGNANMGLGCGNPTAVSHIKEGDVVLDLGSGAGIDCFLASRKVGKKGRVIGIDMTGAMVERAKLFAKNGSYKNVEFILGDIEKLPLEDNLVDVIITNCVINLAPNKAKVFQEAYRVLKTGGKMYISDIVLLKELSEEQKNSDELLSGCVAGALLKDSYLKKIKNAGFSAKILAENKEISKKQYHGIALESLTVELTK